MKKSIFVLGQSIALHLGEYLQRELGENFIYLHKTGKEPELVGHLDLQIPNGGTSCQVLQYLKLIHQNLHPDLLLFGAGLHDIRRDRVTNEFSITKIQYKQNLEEIIGLCKLDKIPMAWMTNTVFDEDLHNSRNDKNFRYISDSEEYNRIALDVIKKHGLPVVDIRSFTQDITRGLRPNKVFEDHIHFTEDIRKKQASFVANWIKDYFKE